MIKVIGVLLATMLFTLLILTLSKDATPSSTLFPFKRIYETATLMSKSSRSEKVDYYLELLDQRLVEMENESNLETTNHILPVSYRYNATAGNLTDLIIANNLNDKIPVVLQKFEAHKKKLRPLIDKNKSGDRHLISNSIDYLTIYGQKLNDHR